jgi:hypothetical protein
MTDREKLFIALLSEGDDELDGRVTSVEIVAMLHELGAEYRSITTRSRARISARSFALRPVA